MSACETMSWSQLIHSLTEESQEGMWPRGNVTVKGYVEHHVSLHLQRRPVCVSKSLTVAWRVNTHLETRISFKISHGNPVVSRTQTGDRPKAMALKDVGRPSGNGVPIVR